MSGPLVLPPSPANLARAASALHDGRLVAFPTETVYGLGADATNDHAVAAIFAAKGRPQFNPLIVHVACAADAARLVTLTPAAEQLMLHFWPGPLTLVLPRAEDAPISLLCSAGLDSLALRCPAHDIARQLIEQTGRPLAAPSANRSGSISPTSAQHVAESFQDHPHPDFAYILAGGRAAIGLESTVLDLTSPTPTLLRPGAILQSEIESCLGQKIATSSGNTSAPNAPGQLASHYAPNARMRLNARTPEPDEAYLAFGPTHGLLCREILNLSENGDLDEAAANLFAYMRQLDASQPQQIAVAPIPNVGLGLAINDRLMRAAAPR